MAKQITPLLKSEFFTLSELISSATAKRNNISNIPDASIIENLQYGCDKVLDPLRRRLGKAIIITSGYRCQQLNKLVGGVSNSWHTQGNAADIHIESEEDAKCIFDILKKLPSVDTALFEHSKTSKWLHVQWNKTKSPRHNFNFNYKAV